MAKQAHLLERIKAYMDAGGIAPTPANYEFWYRYATGADPNLVEAIDAVLRTVGRVSVRTMENIRRELYGARSEREVTDLLTQTQQQLQRMESYVTGVDADAKDYGRALQTVRDSLANAGSDFGEHALLAEVIGATSAMIQKTEALEQRLEASGAEIANLRKDLHAAQSESRTDTLTGLPNRKAFGAYFDAQCARSVADRRPLSVAFCDIDHFKVFNDRWGHRMGDEVLRLVGKSLEQLCHGVGYPARYGGEEFVIAMPGRDLKSAHQICEQIRDFIASRSMRAKGDGQEVGRITLSLGVAQLSAQEEPEDILDRADAALYHAKENGRNRVCVESELTANASSRARDQRAA